MSRFTRFIFSFLAAVPALLGACTLPLNKPSQANGAEGVLYFPGVTNADLGTVPTGAVRRIFVEYRPGGEYECSIGPKSDMHDGNVHVQGTPGGGGGGFGLCDGPPESAPVAFESAFCDDAACNVTAKDDGHSVSLSISATPERATRLHVTVRSTKDGSLHSDSIALRFAAASRLALRGHRFTLPALDMPMLPGTDLELPTPTVLDAEGRVMSIDPGNIRLTLEGDAMLKTADDFASYTNRPRALVAKSPGHATLRWELPGSVSRTIDLEVVDPRDARGLVVLQKERDDTLAQLDFDEWVATPRNEDPMENIELVANAPVGGIYPTRVLLADGRRALGPLQDVTITPAYTLAVRITHDWAFEIFPPRQAKDATLIVHGVSSEARLPVHIR